MDLERYSRQTVYDKLGEAGQEKLFAARVVVIGVGALGTAIANSLCRAGVGFIRLVDRDHVDISNLHRQILYDEEDARQAVPKAVAACYRLAKVNSGTVLEPVVVEVDSSNIDGLCADVDLVLDGSDNMQARHVINEACVRMRIPWIYGGALRGGGATMNIIPGETPCFRCLFPNLTAPGDHATCVTAGVLNMITGIVGCIQSAEAVKLLTGSPDLRKSLMMLDIWHNSTEYVEVGRNPDCPVCAHI